MTNLRFKPLPITLTITFGFAALTGCDAIRSLTHSRTDSQAQSAKVEPAWLQLIDTSVSLDLKPVSREKLAGKMVFINFWASWCPPCKEEMPGLFKLARKYPERLAVLAISQDSDLKDAKKWIDLFPKVASSSLYLLTDEKHLWAQSFQVNKLPETFVYDSKGKLLMKFEGSVDFEGPEVQKLISTKTD